MSTLSLSGCLFFSFKILFAIVNREKILKIFTANEKKDIRKIRISFFYCLKFNYITFVIFLSGSILYSAILSCDVPAWPVTRAFPLTFFVLYYFLRLITPTKARRISPIDAGSGTTVTIP